MMTMATTARPASPNSSTSIQRKVRAVGAIMSDWKVVYNDDGRLILQNSKHALWAVRGGNLALQIFSAPHASVGNVLEIVRSVEQAADAVPSKARSKAA
jgi:hypothetical protein